MNKHRGKQFWETTPKSLGILLKSTFFYVDKKMHFIRKCISRTAKYWTILEGKTTSRRRRMRPEKRSWRESLINPTSSVDDLPWRRHFAFLARSLNINHISLTQMYSRKKNKLPQRCLDCRRSGWPRLSVLEQIRKSSSVPRPRAAAEELLLVFSQLHRLSLLPLAPGNPGHPVASYQ